MNIGSSDNNSRYNDDGHRLSVSDSDSVSIPNFDILSISRANFILKYNIIKLTSKKDCKHCR